MLSRKSAFRAGLLLVTFAIILPLAVAWFVGTQPLFTVANSTGKVAVDPARLEGHVRMLSETFSPRDWAHPANLDRTAAYIKTEIGRAGGAVSEQPYAMEGNTYRNVIGTFGPGAMERIVVGAHYDAFGEFPGADDNASGVAGLIELASLLGKVSLPIRVDLVAFTLEEPRTISGDGLFRSPYGGSAVHAKSLREHGEKVRLMLSLEMLGYFSDEENSQGFPSPVLQLPYSSRGNFIMGVGRLQDGLLTRRVKTLMRSASALPVYSINAPSSLQGIDWSDHFNYWKQGFPALMITDTAANRNRKYHTKEDTFDRLDYARMSMVVQGVYGAVLATAGRPSEESK